MHAEGHSHQGPLTGFVARHERALIVAWLGACAALAAVMGVWGLALNGAEKAVDAWDERWVKELDRAQAVLEAGNSAAALALLERLDKDCPAKFVKHRQDRERERLLGLLGTALQQEGKKRRTLETFQRAVAFDPKNFANHFRLAQAARELGEDDVAKAAFEAVLAIHPTHAPSAAALADMSFDAGNYAPVVDVFERYIGAWQLETVHLSLGETRVALDVVVDGLAHEIEVPASVAEGWKGVVRLDTHGYSARLERVELCPPLRAGEAGRREALVLTPGEEWLALGGTFDERYELSATERGAAMVSPEVGVPLGASLVRVRLTLFRSIPPEFWFQAEKAHFNKLKVPRWRELLPRIRRGGAPEAGTVFED